MVFKVISSCLAMLACIVAAAQDVNPEKLSFFALDSSPRLSKFHKTKNVAERTPARLPGNRAVVVERFFCGQTEVHYTVRLFPTVAATEEFLKFEHQHSQVGFSGRSKDKAVAGDRSAEGWRCAVVNRMVIELQGRNYAGTAPWVRKNAGKNLTDVQLDRLLISLREELVMRAKSFAVNQG